MVQISYKPTPLMEQLSKRLLQQKHPKAFAIANFGDGPILTYQGRHCRVSALRVLLSKDGQDIKLSENSPPPYFVALVQEKPDQPILTVFYTEGPDPVLEQDHAPSLIGQVFAYGESPDRSDRVLAHALYLPDHSHVLTSVNRYNSFLMEREPEVCDHLLLCGAMIDTLLVKKKGEVIFEK